MRLQSLRTRLPRTGTTTKRKKLPKKYTVAGQRKRLSKRMGTLSDRYRRKGTRVSKLRAKQMSNLSGLLSGKKKASSMRGIRFNRYEDNADFAVPSVMTGRGVVASKALKPKKPKKKFKAKGTKGTKGYRAKGGPSPQPVITAFNPSPFGGSAKSLGIQN